MKRLLRKAIWPIILALAAGGIYAYTTSKRTEVETAGVVRGRIERYVTEEARTQLHAVRVISAPIAGIAARMALEPGDTLEEGQLITTIEDTELREELKSAYAKIKEIQGRLDGIGVELPKPSQIEAAQKRVENAGLLAEMAEVERQAAEQDRDYARRELDRFEQLRKEGAVSEETYDRLQHERVLAEKKLARQSTAVNVAQMQKRIAELQKQVLLESMGDTEHLKSVYGAQIEQVRAELNVLQDRIQKTRIASPFCGVVLEKYVDSRGFIAAGAPLMKIGATDSIEIRADILSDEIRLVSVGQKVLLEGEALGGMGGIGRVKKIYPSGFTKISSLGVRQQRVTVLIGFDNSELNLRPGVELDVKIVVEAKDNAVVVPAASVFATASGMAVFKVVGGRARLAAVQTGLSGEGSLEVSSGLEVGDVVIVRPPKDLSDGDRVASAQ